MKKTILALAFIISVFNPSHTQAEDSITAALNASKPVLDLRLRYESNDTKDTAGTPKGDALTLRSVIGIRTGDFKGVSAYADMVNVSAMDNDYKSSGASQFNSDIVPDPKGSELNQAYLQFESHQHHLRFGRQRLIYDNARFIGNVGWRQNEQTYDGLSYQHTAIKDLTINAAYWVRAYPIFFDTLDTDILLANIGFKALGPGDLSVYTYVYEENNDDKLTTYGARYTGQLDAGNTQVLYTAEFASQTDDGANQTSFDADYLNLEAGVKRNAVTIKLGYEHLGSDAGQYGFQTPFATKHKFNGWADKFLNTPDAGLEDIYLSIAGKIAGVKLLGVYHEFSTDQGGADLGSEIDVLAVKKFNQHYTVGAKLAVFSGEASSGQVDTDKFWLWGQAKF